MNRRRFVLAAFCSALFGMLLAVLTNQGTFTPTAAKPHPPRREHTWLYPPTTIQSWPPGSRPISPTPTQFTAATTPPLGNTATPMATTPHPKDPTTTAPSTSANQTATTGTSTPDPTTTTSNPTTTTEGATVTTTTQPTPPPTDENTAQSITTDVQGIGPPQNPQRGLEPQELVTRLFGPEPDKLPGYWATRSRHFIAYRISS